MESPGPVDNREGKILRITGDIYATQVDSRSGSIRVVIASPGQAESPDDLVIVVVPDPNVGGGEIIHNGKPCADARASLLSALGVQLQDLPKHG